MATICAATRTIAMEIRPDMSLICSTFYSSIYWHISSLNRNKESNIKLNLLEIFFLFLLDILFIFLFQNKVKNSLEKNNFSLSFSYFDSKTKPKPIGARFLFLINFLFYFVFTRFLQFDLFSRHWRQFGI